MPNSHSRSTSLRLDGRLPADVAQAVSLLQQGGIGGIPTETVYGLAADAFQPRAVARVFEAKQRPAFDPLIVHLPDPAWLPRVAREVSSLARQLAGRFWPGPLTLVLPRQTTVPDLVTSGLDSVAVRIPAHPLARELIAQVGSPLAAPSANLFGRISPTTVQHVLDQLEDRIDFVLDGGPCRVGVESTVLQVEPEGLRLLRPGGTTVEEITAVFPEVAWLDPLASPGHNLPQVAPGLLTQHYAPRTPLELVDPANLGDRVRDWSGSHPHTQLGLLRWQKTPATRDEPAGTNTYTEWLTTTGDWKGAAARLFACLRRLDESQSELILAERVPETGLGRAINDRLRRAAARTE
ncbi:MAG TPA: threonylcarbamoyl-AMP synthase [Planctomycetaceae bacterium]|nr:threonylcarbamoyl-AMP synthase [Planctomycetaceae bacterium]